MNIGRKLLLAQLQMVQPGLSAKEVLEQSNCFVFADGLVKTFNDEIYAKTKCDLAVTGAVPANELLTVLSKFPDEELEVIQRDSEIVFKGKKRSAGISFFSDIRLPFDSIPSTGKFYGVDPEFHPMLSQAARTCGRDDSRPLTTVVNISPLMVEACDDLRYFQAAVQTGLPKAVMVPASSISQMDGYQITKVSSCEGWIGFKIAGGGTISMRGFEGAYIPNVEKLLDLRGAEDITLPKNISDIIERASSMMEAGHEARVTVHLKMGEMRISSRKETGWFRESKKVSYAGKEIEFEIHPKFFSEIIKVTQQVQITENRMKLVSGNIQFVTYLYKSNDGEK